MAREEVGKQRVHIDLVGATNMGTTMVKGFAKPKPKRSKPMVKKSKYVAKEKTVVKKAKEAAKKVPPKKGKPLAPPPKKKP